MKNVLLTGLCLGALHGLFQPLPAEARHRHHYHTRPHVQVFVDPWYPIWIQPRQPKIRLSRHCVYKPWKNKTVCRY